MATSPIMEVTIYDFTAAWCAPCKQLAPVLHELATDYRDRARVVEIDVEHEPALAQAYRASRVRNQAPGVATGQVADPFATAAGSRHRCG